ncbi:hypothetical protein ACI2L1_35435 [Streptomyces sp. NPDC019531]|uniref:hypothetical protein n=1 Tax=Streptomyces sp. NPDC019531 TaxID=3365062 RepID=UPI00384A6E07
MAERSPGDPVVGRAFRSVLMLSAPVTALFATPVARAVLFRPPGLTPTARNVMFDNPDAFVAAVAGAE